MATRGYIDDYSGVRISKSGRRFRILRATGAIGGHFHMPAKTVHKYCEAQSCPHYLAGRVSPTKLTPWLPYLEQRWQAGCTNASQLWREISQEGFSGSLGLVIRWAASQRKL